MADFIRNFLTQAITPDILRDWRHASKLFNHNNNSLLPKHSSFFYVTIKLSPIPWLAIERDKLGHELNMMVKSVSLPTVSIDNSTHIAYNRKVIIQKKINYEPISITFHDDGENRVRSLRNFYLDYYCHDFSLPKEKKQPLDIYGRRVTDQYGFRIKTLEGADKQKESPFIREIIVFSIFQRKTDVVQLINPVITRWQDGTHDQSSNSFMESTMTVAYESINLYTIPSTVEEVKQSGEIGDYGDRLYDTGVSPLRSLGGAQTIFGLGGGIAALGGIGAAVAGGNPLAAAAIAARTYNTFQGGNLSDIASQDVTQVFENTMRGNNIQGNYFFPAINR